MSSENTDNSETDDAGTAELQAIIAHDFRVLARKYNDPCQRWLDQLQQGLVFAAPAKSEAFGNTVVVIRALEQPDHCYQIVITDGEVPPTVKAVYSANETVMRNLLTELRDIGTALYLVPTEEPRYHMLLEALATFQMSQAANAKPEA